MAVVFKNKYYLYSIRELLAEKWMTGARRQKHCPDIKLISEGGFWKFNIDICGKKETFYIKKGTLKKSELYATWYETFGNYKLNGHCYIRPEMQVKQNDIVIDAGGCEGYYAKYALNMGASKVVIFEPCSELAEGLLKTFKDEIDSGKVVIVEKALGKEDHIDILHINMDMFCASSINLESKHGLDKEIHVVSLDDILKNMGINHIDILKMDIEGAEVDAIFGARKIIKKAHPKLIIATYHSYYNAIRIRDICRKIDSAYRSYMYGCYQYKVPWRPYITFLF